ARVHALRPRHRAALAAAARRRRGSRRGRRRSANVASPRRARRERRVAGADRGAARGALHSRRAARIIGRLHEAGNGGTYGVTRIVQCGVLGTEAEGLDRPPYPGELGKRIYESVSKLAWRRWLAHQTMLINEYRLTPMEPKARKFLEGEMEKFFFGEGSQAPPDFQPTGD